MTGRSLAVPEGGDPLNQPAGAMLRGPSAASRAETYDDARRLIRMGQRARARVMLADAAAAGGEGAALMGAWAESVGTSEKEERA